LFFLGGGFVVRFDDAAYAASAGERRFAQEKGVEDVCMRSFTPNWIEDEPA
jgi:hypothetical protein